MKNLVAGSVGLLLTVTSCGATPSQTINIKNPSSEVSVRSVNLNAVELNYLKNAAEFNQASQLLKKSGIEAKDVAQFHQISKTMSSALVATNDPTLFISAIERRGELFSLTLTKRNGSEYKVADLKTGTLTIATVNEKGEVLEKASGFYKGNSSLEDIFTLSEDNHPNIAGWVAFDNQPEGSVRKCNIPKDLTKEAEFAERAMNNAVQASRHLTLVYILADIGLVTCVAPNVLCGLAVGALLTSGLQLDDSARDLELAIDRYNYAKEKIDDYVKKECKI